MAARSVHGRRLGRMEGGMDMPPPPPPQTPATRSKRAHTSLGSASNHDPYAAPWCAFVSVAQTVTGSLHPKSYVGRIVWSSPAEQRFMVAWQNGDEPTMYDGTGPASFRVLDGDPEAANGILEYETANVSRAKVRTHHQVS